MDGSVLLSPKPTRSRTRPNLNVSEMQYKDALHALLVADPPILDMRAKLGPDLAKHQKQVTPGHLCSLEKLWYPLISSGCQQLVLQSQKIRAALHTLLCENSSLIVEGTAKIQIPCIIDDVKNHIMDCATVMRAMKNDGMPGVSTAVHDLAAAVKNKMIGLHMQILSPIIGLMHHSDGVHDAGVPCPMSPPCPLSPRAPLIDLASIPPLPPAKLSVPGTSTPTTSARLAKQVTPPKLSYGIFCVNANGVHSANGVQKAKDGDSANDGGEGKGTMGDSANGVQKATDGGCKFDVDVEVDDDGYPTIFESILKDAVDVDEDGYPTIFGSILNGDDEFALPDIQAINEDEPDIQAMECDHDLPEIQAINPNVRARKVAVNGVAKLLQEQDAANGVSPPLKKRLKTKQTVKKSTLKAQKIEEWYPREPHAAAAKKHQKGNAEASKGKPIAAPIAKAAAAAKESDAQALQVENKAIKNADALILSAHGSSNADTGRFDIQGKINLPDGSCKTIGIIGFVEKAPWGKQVWDTLLTKINGAKGQLSKGDIVALRNKLVASCKAGHPCIESDSALNAD